MASLFSPLVSLLPPASTISSPLHYCTPVHAEPTAPFSIHFLALPPSRATPRLRSHLFLAPVPYHCSQLILLDSVTRDWHDVPVPYALPVLY